MFLIGNALVLFSLFLIGIICQFDVGRMQHRDSNVVTMQQNVLKFQEFCCGVS